jgi:two-component system, NarL family, sensor histidine kinase BarA
MNKSPINWSDCIKQSNNKPQLAQELLDMLMLELPQFQQSINQALKEQNRSELKFQTHKLHGACCYCGANDLKAELLNFQNQVDQADNALLTQMVNTILHQINRLQTSLQNKDYLSA